MGARACACGNCRHHEHRPEAEARGAGQLPAAHRRAGRRAAVGGLQPRQPVAPGGSIPGGFRPIPTSSQRPKPTNATIVYARTAVADTRKLGRIGKFFKEGDVVFTQRLAPPLKDPMGQNVKVTSVQLLNQDLKDAGAMDADGVRQVLPSEGRRLQVGPDGVVNNLDGADPRTSSRTTRSPTWPSRASCASRRCRLATRRGPQLPAPVHAKGAQRRPRLPRAGEPRRSGARTARRSTRSSSSSRRTSRWARPTRTDREGVAHRARRGRQPVQEHDHRVRGAWSPLPWSACSGSGESREHCGEQSRLSGLRRACGLPRVSCECASHQNYITSKPRFS